MSSRRVPEELEPIISPVDRPNSSRPRKSTAKHSVEINTPLLTSHVHVVKLNTAASFSEA